MYANIHDKWITSRPSKAEAFVFGILVPCYHTHTVVSFVWNQLFTVRECCNIERERERVFCIWEVKNKRKLSNPFLNQTQTNAILIALWHFMIRLSYINGIRLPRFHQWKCKSVYRYKQRRAVSTTLASVYSTQFGTISWYHFSQQDIHTLLCITSSKLQIP